MAPSRVTEEQVPISSSEEEESEEENEEEEEEGESEEESEGEKAAPTTIPPSKPALDKKSSSKKPDPVPSSQPLPSSSESGSGSSSDSESDSESDSSPEKRRLSGAANPNVKPLASKPMEDKEKDKDKDKGKDKETPQTKKPRSKLGVPATPTKSSTAAKRPIENDHDAKDSKRMKKKGSDPGVDNAEDDGGRKSTDDSKKQLFQRLWSEDDEIAILKGMIEYTSKKAADPSADMNAFHDFIKKSLHVDVTRTQLVDKVRRLKKKYENNVGKGKKGEDRTFSKPHEQMAYELSKKIWGGESNSGGLEQTRANGKPTRNSKAGELLALLNGPKEAEKKEIKDNSGPSECFSESIQFNKTLGASGLGEDVLRRGLELIGAAKKSELEEKWKNLQVTEMELYLKRVNLIQEQTKLMLEAIKSSKN